MHYYRSLGLLQFNALTSVATSWHISLLFKLMGSIFDAVIVDKNLFEVWSRKAGIYCQQVAVLNLNVSSTCNKSLPA
jgi:hypothetical protein